METKDSLLVQWLLSGDISIQYQTYRDLLDVPSEDLSAMREHIAHFGWGEKLLAKRDPKTGMWGKGIYSPKFTSTHYTLLELKNLGIDPIHSDYVDSAEILMNAMWAPSGKINQYRHQDMCVTAMVLSIVCYAHVNAENINEMADYILLHQFPDGGWNCAWERGAQKSSLHTTLSVLEALRDYEADGYTYRLAEIKEAVPKAQEFILKKNLFRSVTTGEIIDKKFLLFSYPCRWQYDVLRCMDYFASVKRRYDIRMDETLNLILSKKKPYNHWQVQNRHHGKVHLLMEKTGKDSRWNTLRVLRVLKFYKPDIYEELLK